MTLPEAFITDIKEHLPAEELDPFVHALTETEPTTSIRYNRSKKPNVAMENGEPIGWNQDDGRYLKNRPNFTLDPHLHAGAYYVQEASSQFVTHVVRQLINKPVTALDLCAAPGGKSTALLSALPEGSQLVSNEIDRRRARILAENITKWGNPYVTVTCNAPRDYASLRNQFDLILTDVPCSGEGMFRKDEGAIEDWSPTKVRKCVELQKEIVSTIWPTLKAGGILIYSTCTFNTHEDEEMLSYICEELGGDALSINIDPTWNIHPPLMGTLPCYRFMPHYTVGEGLFMAVVQKPSDSHNDTSRRRDNRTRKTVRPSQGPKNNIDLKKTLPLLQHQLTCETTVELTAEGTLRAIPTLHKQLHDALSDAGLYLLQSGIEMGLIKGRDIIPAHALALSTALREEAFPRVEVNRETALNYLHHEAITLPDESPQGYVIITHDGLPIGFVKNLGNRSNNLYPQEWRIRHL